MSKYMDKHLGNMSVLVGHNVSRYSLLLNTDDLTNAYLKMRNDLGYPLMLESTYRRAIVYNKQGLEKQIESMIAEVVGENFSKLTDLVANDVVNTLNSIHQLANGQVVLGTTSQSNKLSSLIGKALGKGLVKGFFDILDDITTYDDKR